MRNHTVAVAGARGRGDLIEASECAQIGVIGVGNDGGNKLALSRCEPIAVAFEDASSDRGIESGAEFALDSNDGGPHVDLALLAGVVRVDTRGAALISARGVADT